MNSIKTVRAPTQPQETMVDADKPTASASGGPSCYNSLSAALRPPHLQEALLSPTATLRDRQPSLSEDGCNAYRKRCCARRHCCIALVCLLVGFGSGGSLVWALMRSFQGDARGTTSGSGGSGAVCGACADTRLDGAFSALVDADSFTKYVLTHTFRANKTSSGVGDVVLHAIKSPLNSLKSFTCNNVPFTVNTLSCVVKMTNDCLACAAPPLAPTRRGPSLPSSLPTLLTAVHVSSQQEPEARHGHGHAIRVGRQQHADRLRTDRRAHPRQEELPMERDQGRQPDEPPREVVRAQSNVAPAF